MTRSDASQIVSNVNNVHVSVLLDSSVDRCDASLLYL